MDTCEACHSPLEYSRRKSLAAEALVHESMVAPAALVDARAAVTEPSTPDGYFAHLSPEPPFFTQGVLDPVIGAAAAAEAIRLFAAFLAAIDSRPAPDGFCAKCGGPIDRLYRADGSFALEHTSAPSQAVVAAFVALAAFTPQAEAGGDGRVPLLSEAFTYHFLGKDSGRSVRAEVRNLALAAGVPNTVAWNL